MKPLVSILIPAFNAEKWLAQTIRSAVAQRWPRKEVVVIVDEGCRDRTLEVARQMASREVLVVTRPRQTAAGARNDAFSLSQGEYIQWLDADDLLASNKIERQMEEVQRCRNPRLLMSSPFGYFMFRTSRANFEETRLWCDLSSEEWILRKMGENLHMQPATWLVSRELTEAIGPWDIRLIDEDGEYFNRLVLASDGVKFVPDAKVFYRMSGFRSYTSRTKLDARGRSLSLQIQAEQLLSLGEASRVRTACLNYLQRWLIHINPDRPDEMDSLQRIASNLGGKLERPPLQWKYSWIGSLFGYHAGKRAQVLLPELKWSAIRLWDKALLPVDRLRGLDSIG
jgi:glycosyltransferase involved in cell wall biosynthesis